MKSITLKSFPFRLAAWLLCGLLFPSPLLAPPPPAWWAQRGATNGQPDNYAVANLGQLKHFAAKAAAELNAKFPGGAGTTLNDLIASWSQPPVTRDDYAALTLGQLKFVAKLFYDRLSAVGFPSQYPWTGSATPAADDAIANLGQIKRVFSFDVGLDSEPDGLPDFWELYYFTSTTATNGGPGDDYDGDGVNNLTELVNRTSPADFYNGVLPELTIIASPPSIGQVNQIFNQPIEVRVTAPGGGPILANAPVSFEVVTLIGPSGNPRIRPRINPALEASGSTNWQFAFDSRTTSAGVSDAFLKLPFTIGPVAVKAVVQTGNVNRSVTFNAQVIRIIPPSISYSLLSSVPNGPPGVQADRNFQELRNTDVPSAILWDYRADPSLPPLNISRSSSDPQICIPDSNNNFNWLPVGTGGVDIQLTLSTTGAQIDSITKTEHLELQPQVTFPREYGTYVVGSAAEHCVQQIDDRIAGKNTTNLALFSTANHASTPSHPNGEYVWNPACWASDIDLTCFPVWSSAWENGGGPYRLGCLITPRILLVANHFGVIPGYALRFVTRTNQVVPVEVGDNAEDFVALGPNPYQYNVGQFDMGFVVLKTALPSTIKPTKILGSVDRLGVDDPVFKFSGAPWGVPVLGINQFLEAFVQDAAFHADSNNSQTLVAWANARPTNAQRLTMYRDLQDNDSGKPCFLIKNGEPVLVTLWTFGRQAPGSGVSAQHYVDLPTPPPGIVDLRTRIAQYRAAHDDGVDANWQINLEMFSEFPPF